MKSKIISGDYLPIFIYGYLDIAETGCDKLLISKNADDNIIFIPIIYNIKHALEIIIKDLYHTISEETLEKDHDALSLLYKLKIKKEWFFKQTQNKSFKSEYVKKDYLSTIDDIYNQFEPVIKSYYYLEIIKKYIGEDFVVSDTQNTAFRYPSNNLTIKLDYGTILLRITKDDITTIKQDIEIIRNIYRILAMLHLINRF